MRLSPRPSDLRASCFATVARSRPNRTATLLAIAVLSALSACGAPLLPDAESADGTLAPAEKQAPDGSWTRRWIAKASTTWVDVPVVAGTSYTLAWTDRYGLRPGDAATSCVLDVTVYRADKSTVLVPTAWNSTGLNPKTFVAPYSGTCWIKFKEINRGSGYSWASVSAGQAAQDGASAATAIPLATGVRVTGATAADGQSVWYRANAAAGTSLVVALEDEYSSSSFTGRHRAYAWTGDGTVAIPFPVGAYVWADDDEADRTLVAPSGPFWIELRASERGSYALALDGQSAPPPGDLEPEPGTAPAGVDLGIVGTRSRERKTTSYGLCLAGGGADVEAAMAWMIGLSGGGDCVVLRSTGTAAYNSWLAGITAPNGAKLNSCQTLLVDARSEADSYYVETVVRNAEMVFIAGGDQTAYYDAWKGTKLHDALRYLLDTKKIPIGGTSAGMAILGGIAYVPAGIAAISSEALANPFHANMASLKRDFLSPPFLANAVTDTHFGARDRMGRFVAFIARAIVDFGLAFDAARGIACDEGTAACVDAAGLARVFGSGKAYFARGYGGAPETCVAGSKLTWYRGGQAIRLWKVPGSSSGASTFDLATWTSASVSPTFLSVSSGALSPANPY